jgi:cysteine desulfurase
MKTDALPIYLDHNASTPVSPEVVDAMLPYLRESFGNPSSDHIYGRNLQRAVAEARSQVAALIGATADEIVFTSGGTEANNLAIRGVTARLSHKRHIITSQIEHPATVEPCRLLGQQGWKVTWLPIDANGRILVEELATTVDEQTALLTLMHANSETGTIQPLAQLSRLARAAGALIHTDAAQSAGKIPVQVDELDVDLLSIAGHKLYAPQGVGALYIRAGIALEPVLRGGGHERGVRPGTENVAAIVGLGKACEIAQAGLCEEAARISRIRDLLWDQLRALVPGLALNGHLKERLPNTLNVRFPGAKGSEILADAIEVAASTGSACHEKDQSPSAVLTAMGLESEIALGSVRLSLGRSTTEDEAGVAALALSRAWQRAVSGA